MRYDIASRGMAPMINLISAPAPATLPRETSTSDSAPKWQEQPTAVPQRERHFPKTKQRERHCPKTVQRQVTAVHPPKATTQWAFYAGPREHPLRSSLSPLQLPTHSSFVSSKCLSYVAWSIRLD